MDCILGLGTVSQHSERKCVEWRAVALKQHAHVQCVSGPRSVDKLGIAEGLIIHPWLLHIGRTTIRVGALTIRCTSRTKCSIGRRLTAGRHPLTAVFPDRLQHPEARFRRETRQGLQQSLVRERDDSVEQVGPRVGKTDGIDALATLVEHSLFVRVGGTETISRFAMLETIRESGLEQLVAHGEGIAVRQDHARYYLSLAEQLRPRIEGPAGQRVLDRFEADHPNFRAALLRAIRNGDAPLATALAAALWKFWYVHGHADEARCWMDDVLALPAETPADKRAEVLQHMAEGRADQEIANALSISYRTVTTHVTRILTRLGVESHSAAASLAMRQRIAWICAAIARIRTLRIRILTDSCCLSIAHD